MTLAMKDYLNEAEGVSKQRVREVLGYNHAQNQKRHDANRKRKMLQEGDTSRDRKNKRAKEYHALHGKERKANTETRNQFFHMLDVLASEVVRPTAGQVAKKAEALRFIYPKEGRYWAALKSYLQLKRYPSDDIMMIMGVRAKERAKYRDKISDAKRKEVGQSLSSRTDSRSHGSRSQQPEMEASSSKARGKRPLGEATERQSSRSMKTEDGQQSQQYNMGDSETEGSSSSHAKMPSGATLPRSERSPSSSDGAKGSTPDTLEPGAWWEDGYFDN